MTLPPETPQSRRSSHTTPSRHSLRLSLSDELPEDLTFDVFESSEEEFPVDAHNLSDTDDLEGAVGGSVEGNRSIGSERRLPSIRRVGSRQMLVFLTDGNTIGDVSRI